MSGIERYPQTGRDECSDSLFTAGDLGDAWGAASRNAWDSSSILAKDNASASNTRDGMAFHAASHFTFMSAGSERMEHDRDDHNGLMKNGDEKSRATLRDIQLQTILDQALARKIYT